MNAILQKLERKYQKTLPVAAPGPFWGDDENRGGGEAGQIKPPDFSPEQSICCTTVPDAILRLKAESSVKVVRDALNYEQGNMRRPCDLTQRQNSRKMVGAFISDGLGDYFSGWMWDELFE